MAIGHARHLRKHLTEAEKALWEHLRRKKLGARFRRQHPIGRYIVDFVCLELRLIIEVDGDQHGWEHQRNRDDVRTRWLEGQRYTVRRYGNHDIRENIDGVLRDILATIEALQRRHTPLPAPPPQGGREST